MFEQDRVRVGADPGVVVGIQQGLLCPEKRVGCAGSSLAKIQADWVDFTSTCERGHNREIDKNETSAGSPLQQYTHDNCDRQRQSRQAPVFQEARPTAVAVLAAVCEVTPDSARNKNWTSVSFFRGGFVAW